MQDNEARLNITYSGQNGDLSEPVPFDADDEAVLAWALEAVRGGSIPGIGRHEDADFTDFMVDRFAANETDPNRLYVRPKVPFGERDSMIIKRLGEGSPVLEEMLNALGAKIEGDKIVIPTHGIRNTEDGLEVNVRHHYCRFHEGEWKILRVVDAKTVP